MVLKYTIDEMGKDLLEIEDENDQVMMEWEKPYMEKCIEMLDPHGDVLEVGFGMGYSARKLCSYEAVKSYTIIECSPVVWEFFEKFKKEQNEKRPDLQIRLIPGRWEDMLSTIQDKYDIVFFDDYVGIKRTLTEMISLPPFYDFLRGILSNNTKPGTKIGFYAHEIFNLDLDGIMVGCYEYKVDIPEYCQYARGDTMYIPIIRVLQDIDPEILTRVLLKPKITKINEIKKQIKYHKK